MTKNKQHWSYLAAMIDGEGCVSISRAPIRFKSYTYYPQVRVSGTDVRLMKWLVQYFGGNYYTSSQGKNGREYRPLYTWQVNGAKNRKAVLLGVLPYLIIKKDQAKMMLSFLEMGSEHNPAKRDSIRNQISALNSGHWQKSAIQSDSPTTNTPNTSEEVKIESDLMGNHESATVVIQ